MDPAGAATAGIAAWEQAWPLMWPWPWPREVLGQLQLSTMEERKAKVPAGRIGPLLCFMPEWIQVLKSLKKSQPLSIKWCLCLIVFFPCF